ncbi:MAG: chorismate synthase, partial [Dehalococcoidia bacterium]
MIRWFTAGESHGQGLVIIMEGVPAGLSISEEYIATQLVRRQKGYGRGGRMLIEQDWAHIMTGVRHGATLGSPIGMTLENKDWVNWQEAMAVEYIENPSQEGRNQRVTRIRPGHADLPGTIKYGFDDVRNSLERASARETAARVTAGAVAMRLLEEFGIKLHSHSVSIGDIWAKPQEPIDWD